MPLPAKLERIVKLFEGAPNDLKVQALLEYSRKLPELPEHLGDHPDLLERVPECQTVFFLATEVENGIVHPHFTAPEEAPTTRGYASILHEGLDGATVEEVLSVPDDFYTAMGLADAISSMRLRGMGAILHRLKRQVREQAEVQA
ncbi:MAG: SufE family protein [Actinomycetota bacterium]|nr:SufE family protein [Actinomycetota bacterium]